MFQPKENALLIADPFLKDPNFMRSVIVLCSHHDEGSFGFKLNERFGYTLDQLITGLENHPYQVFIGGPVGLDSVHFLHQYPDLIPDAQPIDKDVYWGGDFEVVKQLILADKIAPEKIKFFIGYSGWGAQQLDSELKEGSWLVNECASRLIFEVDADVVWKESIRLMGDEYLQLINYPIDPQLN